MASKRDRVAADILKLQNTTNVSESDSEDTNEGFRFQQQSGDESADDVEDIMDDSNDPIARTLAERWFFQRSETENKNPDSDAEIGQFHFIPALKDKVHKCSTTSRTAKFRVKKEV
jgi:hypothetical protein